MTGRIAIVVDSFAAYLDCDSGGYGARYERIATPAKIGPVDLSGKYGCS
jgi:hypothetical protein